MSLLSKIKYSLTRRKLWIHLAIMLGITLLLFMIAGWWLGRFTHHGERIPLDDYVDTPVMQAIDHASDRGFEMMITDSLYVVGKDGGIILNQNPTAGSEVKEGRKVYVTVSTYEAEKLKLGRLPTLYGKNFERKKRELKLGYEINSEIIDYNYDPGPEGHILKVVHGRDTIITRAGRINEYEIDKGATLKMIVSKKAGGSLELPDLLCRTYAEAKFILESYDVEVQLFEDGGITDLDNSYVWRQSPAYAPGKTLRMGSRIEVYVTQYPPSFCPGSDAF